MSTTAEPPAKRHTYGPSDMRLAMEAAEITGRQKEREASKRMRWALLLIGAECQNYTTGIGSCWEHRQRDAQYSADRWCDGCIAAWGLGHEGAPG